MPLTWNIVSGCMRRMEAPVGYDPSNRVFLLRGKGFSYAFGLGPDGAPLRHLHWGGLLGPADVAALVADEPYRRPFGAYSLPRSHEEELVVHGGRRYGESALKVEFADGTRTLDLAYVSHSIDGAHLAVTTAD